MSLGPGVTVHAAVTATGGGADTALANVLDAAAAVTQPRNKWEAAMSEEEAAGVRANLCAGLVAGTRSPILVCVDVGDNKPLS